MQRTIAYGFLIALFVPRLATASGPKVNWLTVARTPGFTEAMERFLSQNLGRLISRHAERGEEFDAFKKTHGAIPFVKDWLFETDAEGKVGRLALPRIGYRAPEEVAGKAAAPLTSRVTDYEEYKHSGFYLGSNAILEIKGPLARKLLATLNQVVKEAKASGAKLLGLGSLMVLSGEMKIRQERYKRNLALRHGFKAVAGRLFSEDGIRFRPG